VLEELGIAVTAYGVLSRGLLSGSSKSGPGDIRNRFPRFAAENQAQNQKLVARLAEIAATKGITKSQLAIAWALAKSPSIIPVIGARTRAQLAESLAALEVTLTTEEVAAIEAALPTDAVAGTRYDAHQMQVLDSEK
jgi:aryl-alcohol dehydrogenase-like predicted oxidoreductase